MAPKVSTGKASGTAPTLMDFELPEMEEAAMSVAVTVWLPAVVSVAAKTLLPDTSVESLGSCAVVSVLVKCTVPE
jgi:hypothetical protein